MISNDRSTSVLSPEIDNVTQAYCLLDLVKFSNNKNTKGIQNEILYKNAAVVPPPRKISSAYTEPMKPESHADKEECNCHVCYDRLGKHKTSSSKPNRNLNKSERDSEKLQRESITSFHRKRKKSHDTSPVIFKKEKYKSDRKSFKSNKAQHKKDAERNHKKLLSLLNKRKNQKKALEKDLQHAKTNVKFEIKPKTEGPRNTHVSSKTLDVRYGKGDNGSLDVKKVNINNWFMPQDNTCYEGVCKQAAKDKNHKFICNCDKRKENPIECTEVNCNIPPKRTSNTKLVKIKEIVTCLCHKYSQKLIRGNASPVTQDTCEKGLCKEALNNKKKFVCKCVKKPVIKKCTDKTCSLGNKNDEHLRKLSPKAKKMQTKDAPQKNKLTHFSEHDSNTVRNYSKNINGNKYFRKTFQNETDQTGEPFFEMKVNSIDMCLLNPAEVRKKVMTLGHMEKRNHSCICPSHKKLIEYINNNTPCSAGPCEKAFKNKKTNFTCKCLNNKFKECSNTTCKGNKINTKCKICRRRRKNIKKKDLKSKSSITEYNNPLFEVKLNSDNMCILNSDEIHNKIINIEKQSQGDTKNICASGICSKAKKENKYVCICKCVGERHKPEALECSDTTCNKLPSKCFISRMCDKCRSKHRRGKAIRRHMDTNKIQDITSKVSCICAQILSKSNNWNTQLKLRKKSRRPFFFCKKILCTQSETANHDEDSLNRNVKRKYLSHQENKESKRKNREIVSPIQTPVSRCGDTICKKGYEQTKSEAKPNKCICCICKRSCKMLSCKSLICQSISNLRNRRINKPIKNDNPVNRKHIPMRKKTVEKPTASCGDVACVIKQSVISNKCVCCRCKRVCEILRCKSFICKSISNLKHRRKYSMNQPMSKHRRKGVSLSVGKLNKRKGTHKKNLNKEEMKKQSEKERQASERMKAKNKKKSENIQKTKMQQSTQERKKTELLKAQNKRKSLKLSQKRLNESLASERKFERERLRKEKIENKKQEKLRKQQLKELEALSAGKEELQETSCLADFFTGILKTVVNTFRGLISVLFSLIFKPQQSCRYIKQRIKDPLGTYERIKKWFRERWHLKKLQMEKTTGGSETMTVLSDTLQDTALFQAFSTKGKTKKERKQVELKNRERKRRIRKREAEALYGCRHMLLTTLRKTPCLWVYHICPEMYPHCLNLLTFLRNFSHLLLFCLAFVCWTPCIATFELCRAFMCCFLCTR